MLPAPGHLSLPAALALFAASVALSVGSGFLLARSLDRVGARLRITDGLLGILTALGADAPEIATAVAAVVAGHSDLGVGVVLGSNVFNLAALLGLSAIIAGGMRIGRRAVALEGTVALGIAAVAVLVVTGVLPAWGGAVAAVAMLVPYVWLISLRPRTIAGEPTIGLRARLAVAVAEEESAAHPDHQWSAGTAKQQLGIGHALSVAIHESNGVNRRARHLTGAVRRAAGRARAGLAGSPRPSRARSRRRGGCAPARAPAPPTG